MEWLMAGLIIIIGAIAMIMVSIFKPKHTKTNEEEKKDFGEPQFFKRLDEIDDKCKSIRELLSLSTEPLWLNNGFFVELGGYYIYGEGHNRVTMYKEDIKIDMYLIELCTKAEESGIVDFEGYDWILETLVDESNKVEEEYNKVMSHPLIKGGK